MSEHRTTNVYLVAAGQYHDIDFARLELLKLLAEDDKIRVTVASDYSDVEGIQASDFLITYTCNLVPSEAEQIALRDFVSSGKRWFALHGTNAILEFLESGKVECWGDNRTGQLGLGHMASVAIPAGTPGAGIGGKAVDVSSGNSHSCALLEDNQVICWGGGSGGRLGQGFSEANIGDNELPSDWGPIDLWR